MLINYTLLQNMLIRQSAYLEWNFLRRQLCLCDIFPCSWVGSRKLSTKHFHGHGKNSVLTKPLSTVSFATFNQVRHVNKMIDVDELRLPHKYWGWWQHFFMWRHFGHDFDKDDFFKGVVMTFSFVSRSIASDNASQLNGVLTDEAMEDVPYYSSHARNDRTNIYEMNEKDIIYLHVKLSRLNALQKFENWSDVRVLTLGVWITYIKDFQKKVEARDVIPEEPIREHLSVLRYVMKDLLQENRIARFEFERVYDQSLKKSLSDWTVSKIYYQIPDSSNKDEI